MDSMGRIDVGAVVLLVLCAAVVPVAVVSAEWQVVPGGPGTKCAFGAPFSFFYRPGSVNKLAVFFKGGGACWDAESCGLDIFVRAVNVEQQLQFLESTKGILSAHLPSPAKNYHVLYIPYCTADVHMGNNTAQYGSSQLHHVGRVNVESALSFIRETVPRPERVMHIGCSAGSLGVLLNSPYVMQLYPNAQHAVWADSEVGVLTRAQWDGMWDNWKVRFAPFIPALAPKFTRPYSPTAMGRVLAVMANFSPASPYAVYTSNDDAVQRTFYSLGGGTANFTEALRAQLDYVHANVNVGAGVRFGSFVAPGTTHCVSPVYGFRTVQSNGTSLFAWTGDVLNGRPFLLRVDCGSECT